MTRQEVETVLDRIKAGLELNGRSVELVEVSGSKIHLKLTGACGTCPFAAIALKLGIEQPLKQALPGVEEVITVIDRKSHHHGVEHDSRGTGHHH